MIVPSEDELAQAVLREPAHYSAGQTKINRRGHDWRRGLASVEEQSSLPRVKSLQGAPGAGAARGVN